MWSKTFVGYPPDVDPNEMKCIAEDVGVPVHKSALIAHLVKLDYFGFPPVLSDREKALRSAKQIAGCTVIAFPKSRIVRNKPSSPEAA